MKLMNTSYSYDAKQKCTTSTSNLISGFLKRKTDCYMLAEKKRIRMIKSDTIYILCQFSCFMYISICIVRVPCVLSININKYIH